MADHDLEDLRDELSHLTREHRDLDEAILELECHGVKDQLEIKRLKKRKLQLKDRIREIEEKLLPDIIA